MAAPTLTTMLGNVRLYVQDTSTTAPGLTDAQHTTFINTALLWWYENTEKRVKKVEAIASTGSLGAENDGAATFLYPEILGAYIDGTGIAAEIPLVHLPWNQIKKRQSMVAETGVPVYYSALKYGAAAVSASAQNKWKFAFYPAPDTGTYSINCIVRDYPVQLSSGSDIVDLGDYEAKCVEIIAAIFAAPRLGRPDLAADLMGLLPKLVQDKLETHRSREELNA